MTDSELTHYVYKLVQENCIRSTLESQVKLLQAMEEVSRRADAFD